ncbi:type I restriction enzyme, S subunit [Gammaproteobacteria bacterium]
MIEGLKPYAEYKESGLPWIGKVPKHWESRRLRHVCDMRVSNVDKHTKPGETPVRLCNYVEVYKNERICESTRFMAATASEDERIRFGLRKGDVLITKDSEQWNDIGVPALVEFEAPDLVCGYHLAILRSGSDLHGSFLHRVLGSHFIAAQFHIEANGVTRYGLSHGAIQGIAIPLPPLDEQSAIVRFLDHANRKIDGFIRAKRKLIGLLNEQKQAIIHRAVTRGLDPDVPLKDSGIPWLGEIPKHWEVIPLKGVCTIQSGITLGKTYTDQHLTNFPYLRVANVQAGHLSLTNVKTLRLPSSDATRSMLQIGDVLMTEGGDPDKLGRGCVWNGELANCVHQNHIFAVRPSHKKMRPRYLSALLESHYAKLYFLRTAKQTTNLASTNKTTIGQFRVLLPPLNEQDSILAGLVTGLESVIAAIARTEREIALMQEYRTRLTADIVTGKLDVREAAAKLPDLPTDSAALTDEVLDDTETEDA